MDACRSLRLALDLAESAVGSVRRQRHLSGGQHGLQHRCARTYESDFAWTGSAGVLAARAQPVFMSFLIYLQAATLRGGFFAWRFQRLIHQAWMKDWRGFESRVSLIHSV